MGATLVAEPAPPSASHFPGPPLSSVVQAVVSAQVTAAVAQAENKVCSGSEEVSQAASDSGLMRMCLPACGTMCNKHSLIAGVSLAQQRLAVQLQSDSGVCLGPQVVRSNLMCTRQRLTAGSPPAVQAEQCWVTCLRFVPSPGHAPFTCCPLGWPAVLAVIWLLVEHLPSLLLWIVRSSSP